MKTIIFATIFPLLIDAGLFKVLMKEGCDFDRETDSYICVKIKDKFPKMYYGEYNLRCLYCEIETFTKDTFPYKNTLRQFNVSESKINAITSMAFQNLKYIEHLHLENNDIANITENAFYGLRRLFELHLENNKINNLTPGFLNEVEVNAIQLHHNNLVEIPSNVFRGLYSTLLLDLSYNSINSLEADSLKYLNGLEILDMQHNGLCTLPIGVFKHIRNLRTLNIAHNQFTSFPLGLFSPLRDLVHLNISNNLLKNFESNTFLPLRRIEILDLSVNYLRDLDVVAVKQYMPTLRWLVLNDNFWTCSHLTFIVQYLRNNLIEVSEYGIQRYDMMNINGVACLEAELGEDVTLKKFLDIIDTVTKNKLYC